MEDVFVRKKINSDNSFKNDLKTCKTNFSRQLRQRPKRHICIILQAKTTSYEASIRNEVKAPSKFCFILRFQVTHWTGTRCSAIFVIKHLNIFWKAKSRDIKDNEKKKLVGFCTYLLASSKRLWISIIDWVHDFTFLRKKTEKKKRLPIRKYYAIKESMMFRVDF